MTERLLGCDFGASAKAGEQAKKNIVVEAVRIGDRAYSITTEGRNQKLVTKLLDQRMWKLNRRGWTIPDLVASLRDDSSVKGIAFDFPFSIPVALLNCPEFARKAGAARQFESRQSWRAFVVSRTVLRFPGTRSGDRLDLAAFDPWRDKEFWKKRSTEDATGANPALKHLYQNLFNMTIIGASVLSLLESGGVLTLFSPNQDYTTKRWAVETYPGRVARAVGFRDSYKSEPEKCLLRAETYLREHGVTLDFAHEVRDFCLTYRTGGNDPDGADAFLCLVAAISFREGFCQWCAGEASEEVISEEGCIIVPKASDCVSAAKPEPMYA